MYPSCLTRLSAKIEHTRSKVLRCLCNFLSCLSKLSMLVSCPCCCTSPVVPSLSSPWLFSSSSCSPAASPDCVCLNLCTFFNTVQKGRQLAILKFRAWNLLRVTWQERDNLGIGLLYTYLYIYMCVVELALNPESTEIFLLGLAELFGIVLSIWTQIIWEPRGAILQ